MAAVHFSAIPFEPNTAKMVFFGRRALGWGGEIRSCNSNIAYPIKLVFMR